MTNRKRKTADFNPESIDHLAQNKPVVYVIVDKNNHNIYTGSAKRGRVTDRIKEHLPGGPDPIRLGVKVRIEQKDDIKQAQKHEVRLIIRNKPKYNKNVT